MASGIETDRSDGGQAERPLLASVAVRGGRALAPLAQWLGARAARVSTEFNLVRGGRLILREHSVCLRHAILGVGEDELAAVAPLGYRAEDFETRFFDAADGPALLALSYWADPAPNLFRHKASGMIIPYRPSKTAADSAAQKALEATLEAEFTPFRYDEAEFKFTLRLIFSNVPERGLLFVVRAPETRRAADGTVQPHRPRVRLNQWCAEAAQLYPNVRLVSLADLAANGAPASAEPDGGFDEEVFHRLAANMLDVVRKTETES